MLEQQRLTGPADRDEDLKRLGLAAVLRHAERCKDRGAGGVIARRWGQRAVLDQGRRRAQLQAPWVERVRRLVHEEHRLEICGGCSGAADQRGCHPQHRGRSLGGWTGAAARGDAARRLLLRPSPVAMPAYRSWHIEYDCSCDTSC